MSTTSMDFLIAEKGLNDKCTEEKNLLKYLLCALSLISEQSGKRFKELSYKSYCAI